MRICILQSSYEGSNSPFAATDPYATPEQYLPEHECVSVLVKKATAAQQIHALSLQNFDIFINLCDGSFDEDRAGIEVVQSLERFNLPYTGASTAFYEPSKQQMKMCAYYAGVSTPDYRFCFDEEDIEEAAESMAFPLIVKHYNGYGSIGMTSKSRVTNADELRERAKEMIDKYGGALVERFIEGREFTVLVAENPHDKESPITFTPVECRFPPGETFKHFDLKFVEWEGMTWFPVTDPVVSEGLRAMARQVFLAVKGDGYGRLDVRISNDGKLYFLEINPLCGLFYPQNLFGSADWILHHDPAHHKGFITMLIESGLQRHNRVNERRVVGVRYRKKLGYECFALRDLKEGEVLLYGEERAVPLVTRGHVERVWPHRQKALFAQYAVPLVGDTFMMWSDSMEEWKTINHNCNPSAWLDGLNVVARRPIKKGKPVTLDYATFCAENMAPFDCLCGDEHCRKHIRGHDCMEPWVSERYGEHLSDYVKCRRGMSIPPPQ